jgi:hypothetical protein
MSAAVILEVTAVGFEEGVVGPYHDARQAGFADQVASPGDRVES